jgi:hypothetical protein
MFEHHTEPLLARAAFAARLLRHAVMFIGLVGVALGIGVLGYHKLEGLSWIDATLNASMILGGMGPMSALHTDAGKLFASAYALFSGLLFVVAMGVLFAPIIHRLMHQFHFQDQTSESSGEE